MSDVLLHRALGLAAYTFLCSVPATAFLKFFARPLTWGQAFIISICCFVITTALIAVYFFVKVATGIPSSVDAGQHSTQSQSCSLRPLIIAPQEPMPDEICLDPIDMALSNRG